MTISRRRPYLLIGMVTLATTVLGSCQIADRGVSSDSTPVTVRLWDDAVASAYEESFELFTAQTGISVEVVTVPWVDYWSQLRSDIAAGVADDLFWVNAGNFRDYADAGAITAWHSGESWEGRDDYPESALDLYTHRQQVWGVPQIVDPGLAVFVNMDLVEQSGVSLEVVESLAFDPTSATDTLRMVAQSLTRDTSGRSPDDVDFDSQRVAHYGYNASNNLGAILLPMIGSNGGQWQSGDTFVFDSPPARDAITYAASLILDYQVAPPADDTNPPSGNDHAKDLFLSGRLALFQSGPYHLAPIQQLASFPWRLVNIPRGPEGAISPTNAIIMATNARTERASDVALVVEWLTSVNHHTLIGESGAAMPALLDAQESYLRYWAEQGVDVSPMMDVLENGTIQTPRGPNYPAAQQAYQPILNAVFSGRADPLEAISDAVAQANAAMAGTTPTP